MKRCVWSKIFDGLGRTGSRLPPFCICDERQASIKQHLSHSLPYALLNTISDQINHKVLFEERNRSQTHYKQCTGDQMSGLERIPAEAKVLCFGQV